MSKFFNIGRRRMIGMIIGNILIGLGVSLFKMAGMGNDPFSGLIISASALLHLSFSIFLIMINTVIFLIEITLGRKFIGIGTFVNWFLIGYVIEFFLWFTKLLFTPPESFLGRLPLVILGVLVISLGVSLYQTSDAGIAPYDSLAMIMDERLTKLPYFWCRMICDATSVVLCLLTGGLVGLGTFLSAFCLGPFIHFFNKRISQKFIF